ncbi:hypothetical protein ANT2_0300 [plant metagenome]|uniref:Uncharacterized protein n=1 Tax=plant metagenome TaxID=1297885 RepID=A0A484U8T4_9ZZZZ
MGQGDRGREDYGGVKVPPEALRASPPGGRCWWTGGAGSTAPLLLLLLDRFES